MREVVWDRLARGLAVVGLVLLIVLGILVWPLSEPPLPTPTVTEVAGGASGAQGSATPTVIIRATPAATPTIARQFTPNPDVSPTSTGAPTLTPTSRGSPTASPVPTSHPSPSASVKVNGAGGPECAQSPGRMEQRSYLSQTTQDVESYRVYLPPCYEETDRLYPVLYLLHGWPYDERHWDHLGVDEAASAGIEARRLPPFIIVMPRADADSLFVDTSGGEHSFEGQIVSDLIPHVDATYRTWAERRRRAIGGISRGGVWALEIGFRHANLFSTVAAHSPALSANLAPPVYDPFGLLEEPGVAALRIYLDAGDVDWARESTEALHEALEEQGIGSEFVVHRGGHGDALWAANVGEYLAFYAAEWPMGDLSR